MVWVIVGITTDTAITKDSTRKGHFLIFLYFAVITF